MHGSCIPGMGYRMIAFLTLFLGIATGVHTVELSASPGVSRVELYLDGSKAADLGPPWTTRIDLGREIAPRELVAVALDGSGGRLGEARQWINRAASDAEAGFALERDGAGRVSTARLFWRCPTSPRPTSIAVSFDGLPVEAPDPARIPIPSHSPGSEHVLVADLTFVGDVTATAVASFGGRNRGDEVRELTALPVRLSAGGRLPKNVERMDGWFQSGGRSLPVTAVEEGPAEVVFVMAGEAREDLMRLSKDLEREEQDRRTAESLRSRRVDREFWRSPGEGFVVSTPDLRARQLELGPQSRFHFTRTNPRAIVGPRETTWAFPNSAVFTPANGTFLSRGKDVFRGEALSAPRVAEAVAASGLAATRRERRRAVVLVLGAGARDEGDLDASRARRYLEKLRVPLHVWRVALVEPPAAKEWPGFVGAVRLDGLARAFEALRKDLASQRVVWVEGRLDPSAVAVGPRAEGAVSLR